MPDVSAVVVAEAAPLSVTVAPPHPVIGATWPEMVAAAVVKLEAGLASAGDVALFDAESVELTR